VQIYKRQRKVAAVRECQRFRRVTVAVERVACYGAQHEEARCMIDIVLRLLENVEQHTRAHAVEIEWACQARLMIDVARHVE
jgi:hypothetical protein